MDRSTFEAIFEYGAVLSVVSIALSVIAYVVGGPLGTAALLFLGWAGPLGLFYFGGGYLSYSNSYYIIGEELLRGVVWYFISLVAWSIINTQTAALSPSAATVYGLPAVTALGITLVMVATRYLTGSDLKVENEGGQLLTLITGEIVLGFIALYLVLADQAGLELVGLYLASVPVGIALWRVMGRRSPEAAGAN